VISLKYSFVLHIKGLIHLNILELWRGTLPPLPHSGYKYKSWNWFCVIVPRDERCWVRVASSTWSVLWLRIQTGKDFKNKFKKQLESLPTTSLNSEGKEKTLKCLKSWTELKKNEDGHWIANTWFTRSLCCVFIWTIVYLHSVCNIKSPL